MELLPLLLIFAFLMLPLFFISSRQKKAQQKQQQLVSQLGVGDEVRTHSGFYGLIVESYDDVVILESESGALTKWARLAIAQAVDPVDPSEPEMEGTAADADGESSFEAEDDSSVETTGGTSAGTAGEVRGVTVAEDSFSTDFSTDAQRRDQR